MFPTHLPQNRLGVEVLRPETTRLGPGCYDNHEFGTMQHNMRSKPGSRRGYGPSARTAARFASLSRDVTPSPQQYQPDQSRSTLPPVGRAPFSSSTPRFRTQQQTGQEGPGPGTYNLHAETNRKVSWPMRFGRPDRTTLPPLDRHSMEQRRRLAYLRLYF
ncbi:ciliary microtubule-associated protein 3-like [Neosynchiropus ocellatus]